MISLLVTGFILLLALVVVELRTARPMLDLHFFADWNFTTGSLISWTLQIGLFGVAFGTALLATHVQNRTPVHFARLAERATPFSPAGDFVNQVTALLQARRLDQLSYWQDGHWEVHTLSSDGQERRRLTETPLTVLAQKTELHHAFVDGKGRVVAGENPAWNNAAPGWSPDGQQLAFVTDRTGRWEIWIR